MSEIQWYYARENRQEGPLSRDALRTMIAQGEVSSSDLVWAEGMPQWIEAGNVPALVGEQAGSAAIIGYRAPLEPQERYGGFWLRAAAYLIDYVIISAAFGIVMMGVVFVMIALDNGGASPVFPAVILLVEGVMWVVIWLYYALMESSRKQATLGKMVVGLKVTNLEGQAIGFGRATGRFFGKIISGWILMIGFMMAGWTKRKQALHDMMAGTLVLRK